MARRVNPFGIFNHSVFAVYSASNSVNRVKFDPSGVTGTVTLTVPNVSGTILLLAQADAAYLAKSANLSDLNNVATARTNLGLVAGGAGDIWVEKAGDTMTGNLTIDNAASATLSVLGNDPLILMKEQDAAVDNKNWVQVVSDAVMHFYAASDSFGSQGFWLQVTRSGVTVTGVSIPVPLAIGSGGTPIVKVLSGTATWDPPNLVNGASAAVSVTVTGAAVGDPCFVGHTGTNGYNVLMTAHVQAADTTRVMLLNESGSDVDIASGTLRVVVFKF